MTEKELLRLAAKAAGIDLLYWDSARHAYKLKPDRPAFCMCRWNPLIDDGDALRLAVKLKIDIHFEWNGETLGNIVEALTPEREDGSRGCFDNSTETDPYAATRRAIVRAAAEIGRVSQ